MKKAVLYLRVNSTQRELEKQLEQLWAFAESEEYRITNVYAEIASGLAHICGRTIWNMLEDAEHKQFDTVIIRDITRISREPTEAFIIIEALKDMNIKIISQRENGVIK